MLSEIDWTAVGALATIAMALVVLVAAILALKQLREMSKARSLSVITGMFDRLSTQQARKDRWFIYDELPECSDAAIEDPKIGDRAYRVCGMLDNLAYLVSKELVPPQEVFGLYGDLFIRCWRKLQPYVDDKRWRLGEAEKPQKYRSFEQVAKQAERWYRHRYPGHALVASGPEDDNSPAARRPNKTKR